MKYQLNGREVEVNEIDGYDEDAYITSATYVDTGSELTEDELNELAESNWEVFEDDKLNKAIMAAEYAFEGDR